MTLRPLLPLGLALALASPSTATAPLDLDLDAILASHPKIHSAAVLDLEASALAASSRGDTRPRSVASTIKLAVVNLALSEVERGRLDLDEVLTVRGPNDRSYDGEPIGQRYTVRDAIYATLKRSSNTAPNLLAIRMGGLAAVRRGLRQLGYTATAYNYLSAVRRTEKGPAGSTAADMARAARDFYEHFRYVQGLGKGTAWDAFHNAKDQIQAAGHETLGGKIGSNSLSATHTGLYRVRGRVYAIVVFSEENGLRDNYAADRYLEAATTAIADALAHDPLQTEAGPSSPGSVPQAPSFYGLGRGI
jgi:D-alanyl-D-alanine carboxypeptidase